MKYHDVNGKELNVGDEVWVATGIGYLKVARVERVCDQLYLNFGYKSELNGKWSRSDEGTLLKISSEGYFNVVESALCKLTNKEVDALRKYWGNDATRNS